MGWNWYSLFKELFPIYVIISDFCNLFNSTLIFMSRQTHGVFDIPSPFVFIFTDTDMAARHRARASSIQIIKVDEVAASKCRRANMQQFHVSYVQMFKAFNENTILHLFCLLFVVILTKKWNKKKIAQRVRVRLVSEICENTSTIILFPFSLSAPPFLSLSLPLPLSLSLISNKMAHFYLCSVKCYFHENIRCVQDKTTLSPVLSIIWLWQWIMGYTLLKKYSIDMLISTLECPTKVFR